MALQAARKLLKADAFGGIMAPGYVCSHCERVAHVFVECVMFAGLVNVIVIPSGRWMDGWGGGSMDGWVDG
eukprot:325882-Chlamydomonas_euryale.AAC.1